MICYTILSRDLGSEAERTIRELLRDARSGVCQEGKGPTAWRRVDASGSRSGKIQARRTKAISEPKRKLGPTCRLTIGLPPVAARRIYSGSSYCRPRRLQKFCEFPP